MLKEASMMNFVNSIVFLMYQRPNQLSKSRAFHNIRSSSRKLTEHYCDKIRLPDWPDVRLSIDLHSIDNILPPLLGEISTHT